MPRARQISDLFTYDSNLSCISHEFAVSVGSYGEFTDMQKLCKNDMSVWVQQSAYSTWVNDVLLCEWAIPLYHCVRHAFAGSVSGSERLIWTNATLFVISILLALRGWTATVHKYLFSCKNTLPLSGNTMAVSRRCFCFYGDTTKPPVILCQIPGSLPSRGGLMYWLS